MKIILDTDNKNLLRKLGETSTEVAVLWQLIRIINITTSTIYIGKYDKINICKFLSISPATFSRNLKSIIDKGILYKVQNAQYKINKDYMNIKE